MELKGKVEFLIGAAKVHWRQKINILSEEIEAALKAVAKKKAEDPHCGKNIMERILRK